ncbi:MAG: inorganic phosphate transporter [Planctomycetota bacterium]|jgi:PiT family inorganic phosphate transporter
MAAALTIITVGAILVFAFTNGLNDSSAVAATTLASRAMRPRRAVLFSALLHFLGPLLGGTVVASTVAGMVPSGGDRTIGVALCAVLAAIAWNQLARALSLPSSSGQALVGGLVGAALAASRSTDAVHWGFGELGWTRVSGVALLFRLTRFLLRGARLSANRWLRLGQVGASAVLALAHGANDAQKSMGAVALVLLAGGHTATLLVPYWAVIACAAAIGLGTFFGGWGIMRTLSRGIYRLGPIHGFSNQAGSAAVVVVATIVGGPVSTPQVAASSIMGVGSAERIRAVRWTVARGILFSFVLTMPAAALIAAVLHFALSFILGWQP